MFEGVGLLHKGDSLCRVLPYQPNAAWGQLNLSGGCVFVVEWRALLYQSVGFVLSLTALHLSLQSSCFDGVFDGGFDCVQVWLPFVFFTVNLLPISFRC